MGLGSSRNRLATSPLIIVGAGRSGTNALRDALSLLDEFHTWPCDEINYIWRHGNRGHPTDELLRSHATLEVCEFVRTAFHKRERRDPQATLVEKTCATSLRVEFVDEIFPNARFVHITRDARDVVSSAMPRWTASLDLAYVARKAAFVPPSDLPHYALRYLRSRLNRRTDSDSKLSTWGPRFDGLDELVRSQTELHAICAHQWAACVARARKQLASVDPDRVHNVTYRDLVTRPGETLASISQFADRSIAAAAIERAAGTLHGGSLQAWRDRLTSEMVDDIETICGSLQRELGFAP